MNDIEKAFRGLGRTKKVEFISEKIDYASAHAVAGYVSSYLFDVLNDLGNDDYVATYLKEKGYEVTKKEKQKVQVVFEFDRSEYDAYLFLMNQKKTEEVEQVWNAMSGEPVVADIDLLEEDSQSVKLMMISLAILSVEKKVKG